LLIAKGFTLSHLPEKGIFKRGEIMNKSMVIGIVLGAGVATAGVIKYLKSQLMPMYCKRWR
jgi:hypothetical protein